jgi:hypothetical protein
VSNLIVGRGLFDIAKKGEGSQGPLFSVVEKTFVSDARKGKDRGQKNFFASKGLGHFWGQSLNPFRTLQDRKIK